MPKPKQSIVDSDKLEFRLLELCQRASVDLPLEKASQLAVQACLRIAIFNFQFYVKDQQLTKAEAQRIFTQVMREEWEHVLQHGKIELHPRKRDLN